MAEFKLYSKQVNAQFLIEAEAYEGVRRIAGVVSEDIALVTGEKPEIVSSLEQVTKNQVIFATTVGKSALLEDLSKSGKIDISKVVGKREVYYLVTVEQPFAEYPEIETALMVVGSDKRGTIYGLFEISEACGVSPLVYWGDVTPKQKAEVVLDFGEGKLSKEPSVRYRGFFINDEWPAFGGWCHDRFGGFTVGAYEYVFQLLLRLKGNYLWPAMWTSTFSEDGPGLANAELADLYGVVMGASHHEPMCRAGEEWQHKFREYGDDNTWSYMSNKEAITNFWRDGLERNKDLETIITIGMRGEADSLLLGKDATLEDNINVLREVIAKQNELMTEVVNPNLDEIPRMLALYYEVEDYYHGDENTKGLKNSEMLDGVTLLLCDDTYANLRFLPTEEDRDHKGGFGMYFHYDYHGSSYSYEWLNTNRLSKTWEQMTMAYDYGIREMWIVNLGDIKGLEYPICYFLSLAYDFEKYGSDQINTVESFVNDWVEQQYGEWLTKEQQKDVLTLLNGYTKYNAARTPESMNQYVYAPASFREGERVWKECQTYVDLAEKLYAEVPEGIKDSIYTMVYYPTVASLNFVQMNIEAGWNSMYAKRGSLVANHYLDCVDKRAAKDRELTEHFHTLQDGKWIHMMDSPHTGFRGWNGEHWGYPLVSKVTPVHTIKSYVSFVGSEKYSIGRYWLASERLENREFMRPDTKEIALQIETGTSLPLHYEISCDKPWLNFAQMSGDVTPEEGLVIVPVTCDRNLLSGTEVAEIKVLCTFGQSGDYSRARMDVYATSETYWESCQQAMDQVYYQESCQEKAGQATSQESCQEVADKASCQEFCRQATGHASHQETTQTKSKIFVDTEGYVAIDAHHYSDICDGTEAGWKAIDHLSRCDTPALKVLPSTTALLDQEGNYVAEEIPYVEYTFVTEQAGDWELMLYLANRNPVAVDAQLRYGLQVNDEEIRVISSVAPDYKPGMHGSKEWLVEVAERIRYSKSAIQVKHGVNKVRIYGGDPNIILEKLVMYPKGKAPEKTYLGPTESYCVR